MKVEITWKAFALLPNKTSPLPCQMVLVNRRGGGGVLGDIGGDAPQVMAPTVLEPTTAFFDAIRKKLPPERWRGRKFPLVLDFGGQTESREVNVAIHLYADRLVALTLRQASFSANCSQEALGALQDLTKNEDLSYLARLIIGLLAADDFRGFQPSDMPKVYPCVLLTPESESEWIADEQAAGILTRHEGVTPAIAQGIIAKNSDHQFNQDSLLVDRQGLLLRVSPKTTDHSKVRRRFRTVSALLEVAASWAKLLDDLDLSEIAFDRSRAVEAVLRPEDHFPNSTSTRKVWALMVDEFKLRKKPAVLHTPKPNASTARLRQAPPLDLLVLCAVKDEYDQVVAVTSRQSAAWHEEINEKGRICSDAIFTTLSGAPLRIRTTWSSYMGREQCQAVASQLINDYSPRCVAMSGICAGRRGDVSLGDVIFAERLWAYQAGKVVVEEGHERFSGDMLQYRPSAALVQRMQAFTVDAKANFIGSRPKLTLDSQEDWLLRQLDSAQQPQSDSARLLHCPDWDTVVRRLWKKKLLTHKTLEITPEGRVRATELAALYPSAQADQLPFRVHTAPMATGDSVVEDAGIFPRLAKSMRKVLGIDMEASGIAAVAELNELPVVIAKGVVDFGDPFKDDRYRHFAARASAECLIDFVLRNDDLLRGTS